MAWLPDGEKFRRYLYSFWCNSRTWQTQTDRQTEWQTPQAALMHRIARQKRCTSIVHRKLTKVDCSDNWGNIYGPRPGRAGFQPWRRRPRLLYFATIALRATQPHIRSDTRFTDRRTLDTSLKLTTSTSISSPGEVDFTQIFTIRGGSTLGPGGTGPPNVGQAPQIFWFQQQKYAFLKSRLFLYSGEINTRIS